MRTPEGKEKEKIKRYLEKIEAWYCTPFSVGFGKRGIPDLFACIHGTFWGLEIKREGVAPTKLQYYRMTEIQRAGGKVAFGTADKVIETIERWLNISTIRNGVS